jgi:hypothetical protein
MKTAVERQPSRPPARLGNRALLNEEFIAALLRHFRREGERGIARMASMHPAAYCKILTLLVPREHRVENTNPIKALSDEQLDAMIDHFQTALAARAGGDAKLINGTVEATEVEATLPILEPPRRPNRLMMEADNAIGPRERRPRRRKVPPPSVL